MVANTQAHRLSPPATSLRGVKIKRPETLVGGLGGLACLAAIAVAVLHGNFYVPAMLGLALVTLSLFSDRLESWQARGAGFEVQVKVREVAERLAELPDGAEKEKAVTALSEVADAAGASLSPLELWHLAHPGPPAVNVVTDPQGSDSIVFEVDPLPYGSAFTASLRRPGGVTETRPLVPPLLGRGQGWRTAWRLADLSEGPHEFAVVLDYGPTVRYEVSARFVVGSKSEVSDVSTTVARTR